jgi:hypothetical protein
MNLTIAHGRVIVLSLSRRPSELIIKHDANSLNYLDPDKQHTFIVYNLMHIRSHSDRITYYVNYIKDSMVIIMTCIMLITLCRFF